jgi:SAM-dependent methyltransferase
MATDRHHDDPKDLVRHSYDRISRAYRGDSVSRNWRYFTWLEALTPLLKPGGAILDLGCDCGIPVAQELARRFHVTGVDISAVQIARVRQLVPHAAFLHADMTTLRFPPDTFAAVVSFFAIIHLPVHEHRPLLERCFSWLQPGGYFMARVGHQAWTGYKDDWYSAPMYWSHADEATCLTWFQELGYAVLWTRFIPEGDGGHVLVCVRRPTQ